MTNKSHSCMTTKRRFYFTLHSYFSLLSNPYISNISNIYNRDKNLSLAFQTKCDHMISDTKSDHTFHFFVYLLGLYFVSSCMWKLSTYFKGGKKLESTVS